MAKRWRVSDIVRASKPGTASMMADIIAHEARTRSARGDSNDDVVRGLFRIFNMSLPEVCGIDHVAWAHMTHEKRCDALVATAKRLNVPRRA